MTVNVVTGSMLKGLREAGFLGLQPFASVRGNEENTEHGTVLDEFPTVKKVISQVRSTSDGTYQGTLILHYDEGIAFLTAKKDEFFGLVSACTVKTVVCYAHQKSSTP